MIKKMLPWVIIILVSITLIVGAAFILWTYLDNKSFQPTDPNKQAIDSVNSVKPKALSAKEISDMTYKMDDVLTNLATKEFIKISFAFELDSMKAKDEFQLLDFKAKAIVIETLSDLTPDQVQGSKGKDFLSTTLMNKINAILTEGKITHINITNFVLS